MPRRRSEKIHGSKCTVCNHANRAQIDLAIASGVAKKRIAERFGGLSMDAVWRHGKDHLPPEMRAALALKLIRKERDTRAVLLEEGAGTIEAIRALRGPMFARFLAACDAGDDRSAAQLAGRIHEGLALSARITGEMIPAVGTSVTNIVLSPDYQKLRTELIRALMPYPEAREAVAAVFRRAGEAAAEGMQRGVPKVIEGTAVAVTADAA